MIVFTDGEDNGSKVSHGRIVEEVQSSAILLYFIAIGSPVLVDSHTLEPLSELSGGRTLYVPKQEAISPVLHFLSSNVQATGAQIKNAVLGAIFISQREEQKLSVDYLLRGLERELSKEGRSLSPREREMILNHAK